MGFWSNLLDRDLPIAHMTPHVEYIGADDIGGMLQAIDGMTVVDLWEKQPHLATVVTFLARNVAQLGLHTFRRQDDNSRMRDRDSVVARVLARPSPQMTTFDLVFALVGDLALYDRAYWLPVVDANAPSGWWLRRLPPSWVSPVWSDDPFGPVAYIVASGAQRKPAQVPADRMLAFTGYHPTSLRKGSPTVETLRGTLKEQIEGSLYRGQVWKNGGRVSAVLERPAGAPAWSDSAREAFREDWYAKYTGRGPKAGGTPILEDGMTLNRVDFSAKDQEFVEASKLAMATVAAAFHVNPTMVGVLDNANYSNVKEFRRALYGETLGPILAQVEARLNAFLLPILGAPSGTYVEFNVAEKLKGSFEERASVTQTAVGGPWLTRNEARALDNRPAIEGGDELIVPMNVTEGGQASPTDSAPGGNPNA